MYAYVCLSVYVSLRLLLLGRYHMKPCIGVDMT